MINTETTKRTGKLEIRIKEPEYERLKPNILVAGVGGAGNNAASNLVRDAQEGVDVLAMNTDAQSLENALAPRRLQLGPNLTQGLGAGSDPEVGRLAAEESREEIKQLLQGYHICFIAAGMGGGTGTGASPVVAQISREVGLLTVAVVTLPFHFEGRKKMRVALAGHEDLLKQVDTMIVIPNQNLFKLTNDQTSLPDTFRMADNVLCSGVRSVTDLILRAGLKNLDFNDVRSVMSNQGLALIGSGTAEGDNRALKAAEMAINNPLLDEMQVNQAKNVLINITAGYDITAYEVDEINNFVREKVHEDADVHWGANIDESMQQTLRVSVIVTGFSPIEQENSITNKTISVNKIHIDANYKEKFLQGTNTVTKTEYKLNKSNAIDPVSILSADELAVLAGNDVSEKDSFDVNKDGLENIDANLTDGEETNIEKEDSNDLEDSSSKENKPKADSLASPEQKNMFRFDDFTDEEVVDKPDKKLTTITKKVEDEKAETNKKSSSLISSKGNSKKELSLKEVLSKHLPEIPNYLIDEKYDISKDTITDISALKINNVEQAFNTADINNATPGETKNLFKSRLGFLSNLSRKWGRGSNYDEDLPQDQVKEPPPPAKEIINQQHINDAEDLLLRSDNDESSSVDYHEIPAFLRKQLNKK